MRDATLAMLAETQRLADAEFGADSMLAALVHAQTATTYSGHGEFDDAEKHFRIAIDIYEERVGRDHGTTISTLNNLGVLYSGIGRFDLAEEIHRELLQTNLEKYGMVHAGTAGSYQNLATAISHQQRYEEAISLHRKAIESYQAVLNEDNPRRALPLLSIAVAELALGNAEGAELAAQEALSWFRSTAAAGTSLEGIAACLVGLSLEAQEQTAEGRAMVVDARELFKSGGVPQKYLDLCGND
jgi:tetratricopeptide (TPR) repeat protein